MVNFFQSRVRFITEWLCRTSLANVPAAISLSRKVIFSSNYIVVIKTMLHVYLLAPTRPLWQNPNAIPARPLKKYNVSLHHTPQDSHVSKSAPYACRKTLGLPTRAQATGGRQYLNEPYNALNDPHLTRYYSRRFESSTSQTKLFKVNDCKLLSTIDEEKAL